MKDDYCKEYVKYSNDLTNRLIDYTMNDIESNYNDFKMPMDKISVWLDISTKYLCTSILNHMLKFNVDREVIVKEVFEYLENLILNAKKSGNHDLH